MFMVYAGPQLHAGPGAKGSLVVNWAHRRDRAAQLLTSDWAEGKDTMLAWVS